MKTRLLLTSLAAIAAVANLSGQNLLIDFNSTTQGGGPAVQPGYQSYDAGHEVAADFDTKSYAAFGTNIDVTPAWPDTTDNRVQQMIDRGGGNDANWDDTAGDLNLITDFLGIDTRTANGGNANWDGAAAGTPTTMTLTLAGLPAGTYGWTSFHHDTENVHTNFQIELSTDGGATFTDLGQDFYMSDSTGGGNPDSAVDGGGGVRVGPDALTLDSTANFQIEATGADDVVLRFRPLSGVLGNGVHNQIWGINGFELRELSDADGDDLPDSFEQLIIDADPGDLINTIDDVLPGDDFDNDGSDNEDELANNTDPTDEDSDDDTLLDGVETNTDLFVGAEDTGSDPNNAQSDGDGIDDGTEVDPANGSVTDPNKDDTDGDGFNDDVEIGAGTSPTDENDFPMGGGMSILFIGGQAGPTQGADQAVFDFLEERYGVGSVTYQQANATPAGAENAFDVLIISSTPGSGDMRNKFQDSTTPILNWEEALARNAAGEFAVTDGRPKENEEGSITIEVEHPITAGFTVGQDVTMATGAVEFWWSTGLQAPGAVSLASDDDTDTNGFLTIVEEGDELLTGNPAPGRRVMFGITDGTFNSFSDDGKTLFGQAIDWLLGIGTTEDKLQLDVSLDSATNMLSISWDSQGGKLYTLRSEVAGAIPPDPGALATDPLTWPVFGGNMDIVATPPTNTVMFPFPDDGTHLFVVEEFNAPPVKVFNDEFETGQRAWVASSSGAAGTFWELDTPSLVGPPAANSGVSCFGTNIDADYVENAVVSLVSPVIDLTGAGEATLTFFQFKDIEIMFDEGVINVLDADNGDATLAQVDSGIDGSSVGWEEYSKKLPVEALGKNIKLEFVFTSDEFNSLAGWYIDDVMVTVP